jgi:hypothetical protein
MNIIHVQSGFNQICVLKHFSHRVQCNYVKLQIPQCINAHTLRSFLESPEISLDLKRVSLLKSSHGQSESLHSQIVKL